MKYYKGTILVLACLMTNTLLFAQNTQNKIQISGAMKNVMRKGDLTSTIHLDTIKNKKGLYGLGPKEALKGELLIIDGKSYVSTMGTQGNIEMKETFDVKAPFFVFTNNDNWDVYDVPNTIKNGTDLEKYLIQLKGSYSLPFVFKLKGVFNQVDFHIQNLPDGTIVKSPKDAHTGQGKFQINKCEGEIVGFFSTSHQSIFTHHDSYIHMHYINDDRTEMGHIDHLLLDGFHEVKLYLPK